MAQNGCAARIETASARRIVNRFSRVRNAISTTCSERRGDGCNAASFQADRLPEAGRHIRLKPGMRLASYSYRAWGEGHHMANPAERQVPPPVFPGENPDVRGRLPDWMGSFIPRQIDGDGSLERVLRSDDRCTDGYAFSAENTVIAEAHGGHVH